MKRKVYAVVVCSILIMAMAGIAPAAAQMKGKFDLPKYEKMADDACTPYYYHTLLKRYLKNDTSMTDMDYMMLMIGYTLQPKYLPSDQQIVEDSIGKMNRVGMYSTVQVHGLTYLKANPVSLSTNLDVAYAYEKAHNKKLYNKYAYRSLRLIQAMMSTGSGNTPDDAIYVLAPKDIYLMLPLQNLVPLTATDQTFNGYNLKVVKVQKADKSQATLYFNITSSARAYAAKVTD